MKTIFAVTFTIILLMVFVVDENLACYGAGSTNEFPSDEAAYNKANPKMIWGEVTNFLRGGTDGKPIQTELRSGINVSGGVIVLSGQPPEVRQPVQLYIENYLGPRFLIQTGSSQGVPTYSVDSTNVVKVFQPAFDERLILTMTDASGGLVSKTSEGLALGQPPSLKPDTQGYPMKRNGYKTFLIFPKGISIMPFSDVGGAGGSLPSENAAKMWELDPTKYFIIKKPGLYKLTVVQRIYVEDTNTYLKTITLPPASVDVHVVN